MNVNTKFKNVPTEKDTLILLSSNMLLGTYEVLYQMWSWEGVYAESIIFYNDYIRAMREDELIAVVKNSPTFKKDSKLTYSKGDTYTFVNFNFSDAPT
jgi:hypothetical protein